MQPASTTVKTETALSTSSLATIRTASIQDLPGGDSNPQEHPPSASSVPTRGRTRRRYLQDHNSTRALIQSLVGTPHFLTTLSGCRIARWILPIQGNRPERRDCYHEVQKALKDKHNATVPRVLTPGSIAILQSNDTIYVTLDQVADFVNDILPLLEVDVVLMSGQREYIWAPLQSHVDAILQHVNVVMWFLQNLPRYGGSDPYHSKLASFPFGIKQRVKDHPLQATNGEAYRQVFEASLQHTDRPRNQTMFVGYLTVTSNEKDRTSIPTSSTYLAPKEYYQAIASSWYIPSPNGDRPECYRHYEALGLGTAPLTQLSRNLFSHFVGSGLLFAEDYSEFPTWDVLEQHLAKNLPPPVVNRNLVLEEYWMEYVDWYVDRQLQWWDRYSHPSGPTTIDKILKAFVESSALDKN